LHKNENFAPQKILKVIYTLSYHFIPFVFFYFTIYRCIHYHSRYVH